MALQHHLATRYVLPLREGGSLPAIIDTESGDQFVLKFRGAGQGAKALVAEAIAAGIAEALALQIPPTAIIELGAGFGMGEPDPGTQDILRASIGANFGIGYLAGALGYDPAADTALVEPELAASIVWFDAFITNVDRTARNPNLLLWHDGLWLIDHGASLYFHYSGGDWSARAQDRFAMIEKHILLQRASSLEVIDATLRPKLSPDALAAIVAEIPDEWLSEDADGEKQAYLRYLTARLDSPRAWLEEAENARRRV